MRTRASTSLNDEKLVGGSFVARRNATTPAKVKVMESDASPDSQPSIFDTDYYQGDESDVSDSTSPDTASEVATLAKTDTAGSQFSASFLAAIDECWNLDTAPEDDGYGDG